MKLADTLISSAGIFRCCVGSVATEFLGKEVELGQTSNCKYCNKEFTLILDGKTAMWKSEEQIEFDKKHNPK